MRFLQSILFCFVMKSIIGNEEVTVTTSKGTIKGIKAYSVTQNIPYFSFRGIPYSKPRVGPTKFDQPEELDPWDGTLDATKQGKKCPQFCFVTMKAIGDEDCLNLNVYTPSLKPDAKKAVLVWIQGGFFNFLSGDDDFYGPDYFMDQDVILVTFNHRLGAFGFLSTVDEYAPGNAGLRDQNMVLQWVQKNIGSFGGDNSRVTLFGHDTGSSSVHFQIMAPMSQGLFSRAAIQSGSAISEWTICRGPDARDRAFFLGTLLGIDAKTSKELVDGLKTKSAEDIVTATLEVNKQLVNRLGIRAMAFVPVIENDIGQNMVISDEPWVLLKNSKIPDIPVICGSVLDEGSTLPPHMIDIIDEFNTEPERITPSALKITDQEKMKSIGNSIKEFYFKDKDVAIPETEPEFMKFSGDLAYGIPTIIAGKIIQSKNTSPVYQYIYSFKSPPGVHHNFGEVDGYVNHGDETDHQFYAAAFNIKPEPNSPDEKTIKRMTKMWANFANDGNPTSKMDSDVNVQWLPIGKEDNYLDINVELKMEKGPCSDRVTFWTNIFKPLLGDYAYLFE